MKTTTLKGVVKNIHFDDSIYSYHCSFEDSETCSLGGMDVIVKCKTDELFKMQKERIVTLTLEKAKEWYKKGGELKEIALQAFTEEELTNGLPKTWEEFCDNYPVKESEAMIGCDACIINCVGIEGKRSYKFKDIIPSKKSAEAHLAMIQLEQLRNCWWGDWRPEWNDYHKDAIINLRGEITVIGCSTVATFLVFPNRKMAKEFLECFRDLIETAKDLI